MLARSAHVQRCACSQRRRLSVWGRRIRARPVAPASASAPAVSSSSGPPRLVDVNVRKASTAAELRAAAYLRAISFYTYPEGRSEFAARVRTGPCRLWRLLYQDMFGSLADSSHS